MNPLAEAVRTERLRRKWSIRTASAHSRNRKGEGGISNTWWSRFENGDQPITESIREGVARAFSWPADWPREVPDGPEDLEAKVELLRRAVVELLLRAELDLEHFRAPNGQSSKRG